ncbi:TetR/AcrR family transcriptional regulator, partial [Crossiella equi]
MPRPSVREVIVEAALAEFHRGGFTASSVDTITRAAGVPKGSFYNHFRSKEELAALIVGKYAEESEWRHDRDPAAPPLARLRARFETMGAILVRNGFTRGCLLGNMA